MYLCGHFYTYVAIFIVGDANSRNGTELVRNIPWDAKTGVERALLTIKPRYIATLGTYRQIPASLCVYSYIGDSYS